MIIEGDPKQSATACPNCGIFYGNSSLLTREQEGQLARRQIRVAHQYVRTPRWIILLSFLACLTLPAVYRAELLPLIGWMPGSSWTSYLVQVVYAVGVVLVICSADFCTSPMCVGRFEDATGRTYIEDRVLWARLGMVDAGFWTPILAFSSTLALYYGLSWISWPAIRFLRNPFAFLFVAGILVFVWSSVLTSLALRHAGRLASKIKPQKLILVHID
jgi:hypothetical protein